MNYFDSLGLQILSASVALKYRDLVEIVPMEPVPDYLDGGADYPQTALKLSAPNSGSGSKPGVLMIFGHHGRELVNPNIAFHLMVGLLEAYEAGTDWAIGGTQFGSTLIYPPQDADQPTGSYRLSHGEVHAMLELLDIFIVPNVNPNGRDQAIRQQTAQGINEKPPKDSLGRTNQRLVDQSELSNLAPANFRPFFTEVGVDLNRNYGFLHGIEGKGTTRDPAGSQFCGPSPESEVESQNIVQLIDSHPNIAALIDVHSYASSRTGTNRRTGERVEIEDSGGWIIHPWSHAEISSDPTMSSFPASPFDADTFLPEPSWREYLDPDRRAEFDRISALAIEASGQASGDPYIRVADAEFLYGLYPVTGEVVDSAFARQYLSGAPGIDGWALETGRALWEKPGSESYAKHVNGAMAVLIAIAREYW